VSFTLSALLLLSVPESQQLPAVGERAESGDYHVSPLIIRYAQVRIQKRVIIRVPRRRPTRAMRLADIQRQSRPTSYKEKKIGKCLPMTNILGVQMFSGRYLDLITKDRRRIRARLEKKCQARSFYSGFYMEKSRDGKICTNRDTLHSRTGANCEIDRFRELVPQR